MKLEVMTMATTGSNPPIGRTETTKHTESVTATGVIEGDRIAADLVVDEPEQLTQIVQESDPELPLVTATRLDDDAPVHSALLVDPEAQLMLRASRRNPDMAAEGESTEWTVHDIGSEIKIVETEYNENEDTAPADPAAATRQMFDDAVDGAGDPSGGNEIKLDGATLSLSGGDADDRAVATIRLVEGPGGEV